jgi:hypothetical protein
MASSHCARRAVNPMSGGAEIIDDFGRLKAYSFVLKRISLRNVKFD